MPFVFIATKELLAKREKIREAQKEMARQFKAEQDEAKKLKKAKQSNENAFFIEGAQKAAAWKRVAESNLKSTYCLSFFSVFIYIHIYIHT